MSRIRSRFVERLDAEPDESDWDSILRIKLSKRTVELLEELRRGGNEALPVIRLRSEEEEVFRHRMSPPVELAAFNRTMTKRGMPWRLLHPFAEWQIPWSERHVRLYKVRRRA